MMTEKTLTTEEKFGIRPDEIRDGIKLVKDEALMLLDSGEPIIAGSARRNLFLASAIESLFETIDEQGKEISTLKGKATKADKAAPAKPTKPPETATGGESNSGQ